MAIWSFSSPIPIPHSRNINTAPLLHLLTKERKKETTSHQYHTFLQHSHIAGEKKHTHTLATQTTNRSCCLPNPNPQLVGLETVLSSSSSTATAFNLWPPKRAGSHKCSQLALTVNVCVNAQCVFVAGGSQPTTRQYTNEKRYVFHRVSNIPLEYGGKPHQLKGNEILSVCVCAIFYMCMCAYMK